MTIRTGPADFSHRLVTSTRFGGLMPAWLKVHDGHLWEVQAGDSSWWLPVETPTEESFFEALGVAWIPPEERR